MTIPQQNPNHRISSFFIITFLTFLTLFAALVPIHSTAAANPNLVDSVSVTIASACSIFSINSDHETTFTPGTYKSIGSPTTFNITCNSPNGYGVYAVGDSDPDYPSDLIASDTTHNIKTSLTTSGDTSSWHFILSEPTGLSISETYDVNHFIPSEPSLVAYRRSGASNPSGDTFQVSYFTNISKLQPADTYTGKVEYTLISTTSDGIYEKMQNFNCSSLESGQSTTLLDSRDLNLYRVAKLNDGHCWMTENLRLSNYTLTSVDSDVSSDYSLPSNDINNFTSDDYNNNAAYLDPTYGGYYTWYTVTAGTGTTDITSGNAPSSICPKGWRLPTGGTDGEFQRLTTAYSGSVLSETIASLHASPVPNFGYTGYISSTTHQMTQLGNYGLWWSSTAKSDIHAYLTFMGPTSLNATYSDNKKGGVAVRCLAR